MSFIRTWVRLARLIPAILPKRNFVAEFATAVVLALDEDTLICVFSHIVLVVVVSRRTPLGRT